MSQQSNTENLTRLDPIENIIEESCPIIDEYHCGMTVGTMTTIILIRHALTDAVGNSLTGWMPKVSLNREGQVQAETLAERLCPLRLSAIYSSPLERARETAERIATHCHLQIQLCEEAGEVHFGEWTGRDFQELQGDTVWQQFNTLRSLTRPPGGELMLEVQARMLTLIYRLCLLHQQQTIAIVSHADVIKATICHYAGIPLDLMHRLEISPASISIITLQQGEPCILRINDTGVVLMPSV